ncbi:MAG: AmmeMemoRadiSam system protein B [Flavobacteriaceae bacterium]|nr:AmmeMemoRadiSam system protein B [Flavobacteriaceae bacterium]
MRALLMVLVVLLFSLSCKRNKIAEVPKEDIQLRHIHDTIGFAQYDWQMDSIYSRLHIKDSPNDLNWKAAICPHDDYKYAGRLYYESLKGINAPNIILIGVAHRARNFNLQDKIIFGDFTHWQSPYGMLKVSSINDEIVKKLPTDVYVVHDSMQVLEHSLEAIVPFLHKKNRTIEIVPILVPYINYQTIDKISIDLANVVNGILKDKNWEFGKDLAVVISNDAVHYGDEEWSADLSPFGTDDEGTEKARQQDLEIIDKCLTQDISNTKIKKFTEYTVKQEDYKEYNWVWCGRYSVPFGLAFANKLNLLVNNEALKGTFIEYQSSIDHKLITVEDLGMGTTAIATQRHWVAYASIRYE